LVVLAVDAFAAAASEPKGAGSSSGPVRSRTSSLASSKMSRSPRRTLTLPRLTRTSTSSSPDVPGAIVTSKAVPTTITVTALAITTNSRAAFGATS
jgi:hypothetical protein